MAKLIASKDIERLKLLRWKARTDLLWFSREILGYKDVDDYVHGPVANMLQKFPKPDFEEFARNDIWDGKKWIYTPLRDMQDLDGGRRRLILDSRSMLKTTLNAQAHTIQWIINYPSIRIAIFQSSGPKAEAILREIKNHFKNNMKFRELFPEHCPPLNKADDWGVADSFVSCARPKSDVAREPTVLALSIDKGTAGLHFHVIKYSDIVEPENVKNKERIQKVKEAFYVSESLLVTPLYWMDVEGTRYHAADLYGKMIETWWEEKLEGKEPNYKIHIRSVYKRIDPETKKEQTRFTPDTANWKLMENERGEYIPWWTKQADGRPRFTFESLEKERKQDEYIFNCQKMLNPSGAEKGREVFQEKKFQYISLKDFRAKISIVHYTVTVDTAETVNARSNHSVLTVCGWDKYNMCWVREIFRGKWLPDELVDKIFEVNTKYRPSVIKIEETSFVRGLQFGLTRRMQQDGIYLPLEFLKRENQISKEERIQNTLQPYYSEGLLKFVMPYTPDGTLEKMDKADLATWEALKKELFQFPLGTSDDILDTLADQFVNKDFLGRFLPRNTTLYDYKQEQLQREMNKFYGFDLYDQDSELA